MAPSRKVTGIGNSKGAGYGIVIGIVRLHVVHGDNGVVLFSAYRAFRMDVFLFIKLQRVVRFFSSFLFSTVSTVTTRRRRTRVFIFVLFMKCKGKVKSNG